MNGGQQRVGLTMAGRLTGGNTLVAEYARQGAGGVEPLGIQDLADGLDSPYWRTAVLDPPTVDGGPIELVRIRATDATTDAGGWVAYSQPALRDVVTVQQYLAGAGPVAVAWQIALLFPCQEQPRFQRGITQPSRFGVLYGSDMPAAFGDATWLVIRGGIFAPVLREASVTGLPTVLPGAPAVDDVQVYRFEYPYPTGAYQLSPQSVTVPGWAPPPGWGDRPAR